MERELAIRRINDALSREYNSLTGYVLNSSPWTTEKDDPALELLQRLADTSEKTAGWLTVRLREDLGAGPTIRAFEYWKYDLNYLSMPFLLKFTLEHYERVAAEYTAMLETVAGDAALEAIFRRLKSEAESAHKSLDNLLQGVEDEPEEEEEDFEPFPTAAEGAAEEAGEERKVRTFKRPYAKPNYGQEPPKPVKVEPRTKP